ncbi:hypothetical protein [Hyphococcus sp.]|uniref:hypothetical protein n=1 Tax=Hyphococcus sp. TaxID=2038636 RepID=UPI003753C4D3
MRGVDACVAPLRQFFLKDPPSADHYRVRIFHQADIAQRIAVNQNKIGGKTRHHLRRSRRKILHLKSAQQKSFILRSRTLVQRLEGYEGFFSSG